MYLLFSVALCLNSVLFSQPYLSWSQLRIIMYLDDDLKGEFYFEMCIRERWSTRQLQERIDSMLYERTAISKKPAKLIRQEPGVLKKNGPATTELVFKDPYFLDFPGLQDVYSEKDLEAAIIVELQKFIIEPGSDFAFIARQKRIVKACHGYRQPALILAAFLNRGTPD